ncbi:MAG: LexA family transcriptional repressor, partial [Candidatus Magasanikbacteria bacterium CG10_big_fil_rev_8_21_14_0_10_43_6]
MNNQLYEKRRGTLVQYYKQHRCLPSYEKVKELFDVKSKNSAYKYVEKFIEDGLVAKADDGRLIPTHKLYELRVLGSVQAGFPTPAEEELADTMSLDEFLVENPAATFLLHVNG